MGEVGFMLWGFGQWRNLRKDKETLKAISMQYVIELNLKRNFPELSEYQIKTYLI